VVSDAFYSEEIKDGCWYEKKEKSSLKSLACVVLREEFVLRVSAKCKNPPISPSESYCDHTPATPFSWFRRTLVLSRVWTLVHHLFKANL
jgi:hypothetical protein